jgi:hypothetical protein
MRHLLKLSRWLALASTTACAGQARPLRRAAPAEDPVAVAIRELTARYRENEAGFFARDPDRVMRLRHPDYHAITPDGNVSTRAQMDRRTRDFLDRVERFDELSETILRLTLAGDTAHAIVDQRTVRQQRGPDGALHEVRTSVTQRESWIRTLEGWLMWRVDQIQPGQTLVDGRPPELAWQPSWPGTSMAVVSGNPYAAGTFVFRFRMPDGYWICPHTHPVHAHIRTVSGTFVVGMGTTLDTSAGHVLGPGQDVRLEAGMAHYEGARGATEIEVRGTGPWGIAFVNPGTDPAQGGVCR